MNVTDPPDKGLLKEWTPCSDVLGSQTISVAQPVPCEARFYYAIVYELERCAKEFYLACRFGAVVRRVCPFGPVYESMETQLGDRIDKLTVAVEELKAKA